MSNGTVGISVPAIDPQCSQRAEAPGCRAQARSASTTDRSSTRGDSGNGAATEGRGPGLVICPKNVPRDNASQYAIASSATSKLPLSLTAQAEYALSALKFPGSELVDSAASLFPESDARWDRAGHPWRIVLAPGSVRLTAAGQSLPDAAESAAKARERDLRAAEFVEMFGDMPDAVERSISRWSAKSRCNLVYTITTLDLHGFVSQELPPCMVTLTLPGRWWEVAPDSRAAAAIFTRFSKAWRRRYGQPMWIWKREFQRRGAPHWHLWTVPSCGADGLKDFRRWLSLTWANCVGASFEHHHEPHISGGACAASEWCRSLLAGSGLDFAEGARARDPKRLAIYFLKESHGAAKQYQNEAPWLWCEHGVDHSRGEQGPLPERRMVRGSLGRFWGVAGLQAYRRSVDIPDSVQVQVARVLRHVARSYRPLGVVTVERHHYDAATGEVRTRRRRVNRRRRSRSGVGFVAVNDGALFGSQLAMFVTRLLDDDAARPSRKRALLG